jgi:RHS repeat-associated protein
MKIKHAYLCVALLLCGMINVFGQSQDQNYAKTTRYLEPVVLDSDFTSSFGGWLQNGSVNYSLENGRAKVNVNSSWEGVRHELKSFPVEQGETYTVKIKFDKGNTASSVRFYFQEFDANGNHIRWPMLNSNLLTGEFQYNYTVGSGAKKVFLRIDKDNTNTSTETYFYIDHVSIVQELGNSSIEKLENVSYSDGFGKTKQNVSIKQTPLQKDLVQHMEYDQFGRVVKQYLPLPSTQNSGNYVANASAQIATYYQNEYSDQHPFSETRYENSPMNRKVETSAPGNSWELLSSSDADHTNKYDYAVNGWEEVTRFEINENDPSNPLSTSFYSPGQLLKNITKNENWVAADGLLNTREFYTDKNGKKVAEFNYESVNGVVTKLTTYYVYDDKGNLRYILPPKMFNGSGPVASYPNYNTDWPLSDFVTPTGIGGALLFSINNNTIHIEYLQLIFSKGFPTSYTLNLQTTKTLAVLPPLPDMYIGKVMGENAAGDDFEIGEASIVNGNLVIDRTSTALFTSFSGSITASIGASGLTQTDLDNLAYQYKYDDYNRQIEQKVPGKDWEYSVFDLYDRPILTQDANLRGQNKWMFNKYDAFGRVVYSGLYTNNISRAALQTLADDSMNLSNNKGNYVARTSSTSNIGGLLLNYSNDAFPTTSIEVLTVNYYDDYNFTDADLPTIPTQIFGQDVTTRTRNLHTASWSKILGTTSTWSKTYTFYDKRGRAIYNYEKNHLGGNTQTKNEIKFTGTPIKSEVTHKRLASSPSLTIVDRYEYDTSDRVTKYFQKINSQPEELISENSYDELGQLTTQGVGGKATNPNRLQTVNYDYNIRGWLTNINDVDNMGSDLFAYNVRYDESTLGSASVSNTYNGNIKQVIWRSAHNNLKKSYAYEYDYMGRFSSSHYRENNSLTAADGRYETSNIEYDPNGNILKLRRWSTSSIPIDDLVYHYDDGNQLKAIVDGNAPGMEAGFDNAGTGTSESDYWYDSNGNLTRDLNKGISNIAYNHLDLVEEVNFFNGNKIEFTYDANGVKLSMKTTPSFGVPFTTDYLGPFQYGGGQLQFFQTAEGYVRSNFGTYEYTYIYKDHKGNNRVSYKDTDNNGVINSSTEILSSTDHYVMGLTHAGEFISSGATGYNYKYQGKELLEFADYNMYDFGSRMYDAAVGRWFNPDPRNQFYSPYLAMGNNYIVFADPDGEWIQFLIGAVVGGVINVVANLDNIDSFGDGLAYFGIGAASGVVAATGNIAASNALLSAGNSIYSQYDQTGTVDPAKVFFDTAIGVGTGKLGQVVGKQISPHISKLTNRVFSNGTSSVVSNYASDAIGSTITGVGLNTVSGLAQGQSFEDSFNASIANIPQSLAISFIGTTGNTLQTKYYQNRQREADIKARERQRSLERQEELRIKREKLAEANAQRRMQELESLDQSSHFNSRHGAATTRADQQFRALTGFSADGNLGRLNHGSKYLTFRDMLNATQKAQSRYLRTGETRFNIEVSPVGKYLGEGFRTSDPFILRYSNTARFIFNSSGNILTSYPNIGGTVRTFLD